MRVRVIGIIGGEVVVEVGNGSFVGAVVVVIIGDAGGAPGEVGGVFVAAEFAVVLDEAADYRVKVAFGGDVEVQRGAVQIGDEGKALQRIALFDSVVGSAAGRLHGLRQEGGFFEFGIGRAAVVGKVGKQGGSGAARRRS